MEIDIMKKNVDVVRGYVQNLPESTLHELHDRLTQRFADDLAESLKIVQESPEMNRWLASADSSLKFFELIDELQYQIDIEAKRRSPISLG